jgi:rod shape-determining protein MreC
MDFLLNRYRNLTVLLVVVVGQLLMLAYQVKTNRDVPLIRVWAVSTVTPVEQALEFLRRHTIGVAEDYFVLVHVREQNEKMQHEMDKLKLENHFLKNELSTADRVKQLTVFQEHTPSSTLAARVIGNGTGANSRVVFVDRGSTSGVQNGMAVITPDGIVGKVVAAYPTASLVMLMTDPTFAAGVISQKNRVHGTLKGQGGPKAKVDYVQNEEKVDPGEWFYTSGDDGIFPRGFPVGQVTSVQNGRSSKEILVTPVGWQSGLDEVLIVTQGVHQPVPEPQLAAAPVKILPPPADQVNAASPQTAAASLNTEADKLKQEYKQLGEKQNIPFGAGTKPPDFSKVGQGAPAPQGPATAQRQPATTPAAPGTVTASKPPLTGTNAGPTTTQPATSPTTTTGAPVAAKPRPRAPVLETDPTDADPDNEAVVERLQRERANSKPVENQSTEILPAAPPPKRSTVQTSSRPLQTTSPQSRPPQTIPAKPIPPKAIQPKTGATNP